MVRIFRVFVPSSTLALFLSELVVFYSAFILASMLVMDIPADIFLLYEGGLFRITLAVISLVLGLYFQDLYTDIAARSLVLLVQQVCFALGLCFLAQALIGYVSLDLLMPRWVMLEAGVIILVVAPIHRRLFGTMVVTNATAQRVLFVGDDELVRRIHQRMIDRPEYGLVSVGYLREGSQDADDPVLGKPLGQLEQLEEIYEELKPDRIVIGLAERRDVMPVYDLLRLRLTGVNVEDAGALFESLFGRLATTALRPSRLIFSAELGPKPQSVMWQSIYSSVIAFVGLIVCLPVMAIVAIAVKFSSPGPVMYRQTRVGLHGKPFTLLKFRSMYTDAESETGAVWASKNDPRVTGVGRWVRKLRLDEIPQFINVLRGDMSLVGPRPERPEFVKEFSERIPFYPQRLCVKPGITGWAQINHKYGDTVEDTVVKLEYDLYYIKNLSPSLDFYIIFNTMKVILLSRGAQ